MKRILITVVAIMMAATPLALAQPRGGRPMPGKPDTEKKDEPEKPAPELKFTSGMFGVAHQEKDWYFEIPDNLLGRRILAVTRYVSNTPGASKYGGEEVTESMIYWEKASNGNLLLRVDALTIQADKGQDIEKAVKVSSEPGSTPVRSGTKEAEVETTPLASVQLSKA